MIPAGFKVNGGVPKAIRIPPQVKKLIGILDALPPKELITTYNLAALANCASGHWVSDPTLSEYRAKIDGKLFWGNKETIVELKQQLGEISEN